MERMTEMTEPKRWPNNAMALRDACADEAFETLKDLQVIERGVPPEHERALLAGIRERQHKIRLLMALAGAPIVVETPRGVIEVTAGLSSSDEAKA